MTPYKINIESTSNTAIIKFTANEFLVKNSYEFKNIDEAANSPLAQQLFYLPFVKTVYISSNFIAIERYNIVTWEEVAEEVAEQIQNYLNTGNPVIKDEVEEKKVPVTVYAESTPNPAVMRFVANKKLVTTIWEFKNIDEATDSPLATSLFHFPFIKEVFLDDNNISLTKYDRVEWNDITMELREFLREYIAADKTIITANAKPNKSEVSTEETKTEPVDATSQQIIDILDEYVKPAVAGDGGNILFKSYDAQENKVSVVLQGACSGCPSSTFTLKNGIETMLKEMLNNPGIKVEALNS